MKRSSIALAGLLCGAMASAQVPATLQPFVKIDAPVVVLENVRLIDGTGAPAQENQRIVLDHGKNTSLWARRPRIS